MRTFARIVGVGIGAAFGLVACYVLLPALCGGNLLAAGFLFLPAAAVSLIVGGYVGALAAKRIAMRLAMTPSTDAQRRSRRVLFLALILGVPSAFVAVIWIGRESRKPPSDAAMLRHFERHESTFVALAQMASADKGLDRVDDNWTMPADTRSVGVSPERLAQYRRMLGEVGTPRGFHAGRRSDGDDGIDFLYWLEGSAVSDDIDKGFAYRTTPPVTVVPTLDGIHPMSRNGFVAYRRIHGNWYIFYEFIPD